MNDMNDMNFPTLLNRDYEQFHRFVHHRVSPLSFNSLTLVLSEKSSFFHRFSFVFQFDVLPQK